jgi:hypothetical protein
MSEEIKQETVETPEEVVEEKETKSVDKTFTQAELDDIVAKRLERERKKFDKFADYDDLKTKASEYEKKLEEQRLAELSEKERAEEVAKKFEEERNQYAKQLEELNARIEREKKHTAFIKAATSANIAYIDDAIKLADLSAVTIDEEGNVVGVEDVVKSLVEHKPFLVAKKQTKSIGEATNGNQEKSEKTADQLLKEAADKVRRTGKPEDKMAYAKLKRELGA